MNRIKTFENFEPTPDDVEKTLEIIKSKYAVKQDKINLGEGQQTVRYIVIEDKNIYITGPLANKGYLRSKIFNDISDEVGLYSKPSVNLAIKQFIDLASK